MKKKHLLLLCLLLSVVFSACKSGGGDEDKDQNGGNVVKENLTSGNQGGAANSGAKAQSEVMSTYTGMFVPIDGQGLVNKITISINSLSNGEVQGNSIVSGNNRPFKGTYTANSDGYAFSVNEPGDDKYDGKFEFSVITATGKLTGKWMANDKKLKAKSFNLDKRAFQYTTDKGQYSHASANTLVEEDVANMTKSDLRLMRNEIYARHGYAFKMKDMRAYFDNQDWYMPLHTDIRNMLTEVEKKNVELIKRYEKYAAEYYDSFGR